MANPQLKHGYMRIVNEVIDALIRSRILEPRGRMVLWVLRNTWGWKRKMVKIGDLRTMEKDMNISKSSIARAIKTLSKAKIFICDDDGRLGFNKDWETWAKNLEDTDGEVSSFGLPSVPTQGHVPKGGQRNVRSGTPLYNYKDSKDKQNKGRTPVPFQGHTHAIIEIVKAYYAAKGFNLPEVCDMDTFDPFAWDALSLLKVSSFKLKLALKAIPDITKTAKTEDWHDCTLKAIAKFYPEWEVELSNDEKKKIHQADSIAA